MHLELFADGKTYLHKIDPRIRWIAFFPFAIVIAVSHNLHAISIGLLGSILLVILAQLNFKQLLSRLMYINLFSLLLIFLVPLSYPGRALWQWWILSASIEGYLYVLMITVKINTLVLATISILGTTTINALAHALIHLKVPPKLVMLFFFFYRYISVLHQEFIMLNNAAKIRCFNPRTNVLTYKTYAYMIGMLLVRSFERSRRIYLAMLCRGFSGTFHLIDHFKLKRSDFFFLFLFYLFTFILVVFL